MYKKKILYMPQVTRENNGSKKRMKEIPRMMQLYPQHSSRKSNRCNIF